MSLAITDTLTSQSNRPDGFLCVAWHGSKYPEQPKRLKKTKV